jgi:replicative DNA helicase
VSTASSGIGLVPPNNIEAERAVLGAILLDSTVLLEIQPILAKEDFYKLGHQTIYQAMLDFHNENSAQTIDLITLADYVKSHDLIEKCGGLAYISSLTDDVPSTTNATYYARILKSLSLRRQLLVLTSSLRDKAFDEGENIQDVVDKGEEQFSRLNDLNMAENEYKEVDKLLLDAVQNIQDRMNNGGNPRAVKTDFTKLDSFISGGFKPQEYIIIGARPSIGKTAFALSLALNMITREKKCVGFMSLEMPATSLVERMIASISRVNFAHIRSGVLTQNELDAIINAADILNNCKLYIQDTPNMTLVELRSQARKMKRERHIDVLFIDYIGLIQATDVNSQTPRHEVIAGISRALKQLARELDIPIIVLSQVGRQSDGVMPKLADLRESGSIEQDADVVIFLHRDKMEDNAVQNTEVVVAKNRNGVTDRLMLGFNKSLVKFEELANDYVPPAANNQNKQGYAKKNRQQ